MQPNDLDRLLESDLEPLLARFPEGERVVSSCLEENRDLFGAKIAELGAPDARGLEQKIRAKILEIEVGLTAMDIWRPLYTKDGLKNTVRQIVARCPADKKGGLFLKERVAKALLKKLPPVQLQAHVDPREVRALSPLSVLALTRFTETKEWQSQYLAELALLTARDFERRDIRCLVVDSAAFAGVLRLSEHAQKPWRLSHNKEAGVILCFSLDEEHGMPAPLTQYIAVFMHYFFEVASVAAFSAQLAIRTPEALGRGLRDVIRSHVNKFPFFHPNAYSEHLFWDEALTCFSASFPEIAALHFFNDTVDCGGYANGEIVSLNLVDHLWNINLSHQSGTREYFGEESVSFLYHFREGLWYDTFRNLLQLPEDAYRRAVLTYLDQGDEPFTNRMMEERLNV